MLAFERSVLLAMRDDPRGVAGADSRQLRQLFRRSRVDVDALVGFLQWRERFDGSGWNCVAKASQRNSAKMIVTYGFNILGDLQLDAISRLLVFNKMDLADPEELENQCEVYNGIAISAIDRRWLDKLVNEISARLNPEPAEPA